MEAPGMSSEGSWDGKLVVGEIAWLGCDEVGGRLSKGPNPNWPDASPARYDALGLVGMLGLLLLIVLVLILLLLVLLFIFPLKLFCMDHIRHHHSRRNVSLESIDMILVN